MNVLVTGGAGFIGSHLCDFLLAKNHTVFCVDNFSTSSKQNIEHLAKNTAFRFIEQDVTIPLSLPESIDAIFHLASPASPNHHSRLSYHTLAYETMMVNTKGTNELLKLADVKKARFLFASTSEIYGDPTEHPQKESYNGNVSTTGPRSVYDEAKRFGETLTAYYWRTRNVNGRIARIFNTYGPRIHPDDMRMLGAFILQAIQNKPITVYGDGSQTRSLCYVSDLVEGLYELMFGKKTEKQIVNLGSTEEHSVMEYAQLVKKLTGSTSEIVQSEQLPQDDPKKRKPDVTKAKALLGWEPKVNLEQGIRNMIHYYQKTV